MAHDWTVMGTPLSESAADADMAELIREHEKHNLAFFNGRPELEYWLHDEDVTLHGGFDISGRGWPVLEYGLTRAAGRLSEGRVTFIPLGGRIAGDFAYLAGFEDAIVKVDGAAPRPMKLRVTTIFQRINDRWLCVHRHGEMSR